jgi:hypothetical protein
VFTKTSRIIFLNIVLNCRTFVILVISYTTLVNARHPAANKSALFPEYINSEVVKGRDGFAARLLTAALL